MKLKLLITILSFFFLTGFFGSSYDTLKIETESSYATEIWRYNNSSNNERDVGIVFLHGKKAIRALTTILNSSIKCVMLATL